MLLPVVMSLFQPWYFLIFSSRFCHAAWSTSSLSTKASTIPRSIKLFQPIARFLSVSDVWSDDHNDEEEGGRQGDDKRISRPEEQLASSSLSLFPVHESFLLYGELRPTRYSPSLSTTTISTRSSEGSRSMPGHYASAQLNGWGIHRQHNIFDRPDHDSLARDQMGIHCNDIRTSSRPEFPYTIDQVATGAAQAIAYTLCGPLATRGEQDASNVDPNWLNNMWAGDKYLKYRRPVRQGSDRGRIGIEIDGIMWPGGETEDDDETTNNILTTRAAASPASTIRCVSLALAGKLARHEAWTKQGNNKDGNSDDDGNAVPVVVFFNTIKQALVASQELRFLKQIEANKKKAWQKFSSSSSSSSPSRYDTVSILPLGEQDADIPSVLMRHERSRTETARTRRAWLKGDVDPRRGIIVVVQPTDYNQEYWPPGPSVGTLPSLQRLVAKAALHGIAVVVVSPRFLQVDNMESTDLGWDQSGYEQSASFGGLEPPSGPTPWLLRDFTPPVYSWVGQVIRFSRCNRPRARGDHYYYYSDVSMVQSVLHRQRAWHIFAQRRLLPNSTQPDAAGNNRRPNEKQLKSRYYEYLASTKTVAGRPTRDICFFIWQEFASFSLTPEQ